MMASGELEAFTFSGQSDDAAAEANWRIHRRRRTRSTVGESTRGRRWAGLSSESHARAGRLGKLADGSACLLANFAPLTDLLRPAACLSVRPSVSSAPAPIWWTTTNLPHLSCSHHTRSPDCALTTTTTTSCMMRAWAFPESHTS